jgi:hypothetical protein
LRVIPTRGALAQAVERLPVLIASDLDPTRPSIEIDPRVKALVRDGLSVYRVDRSADGRPRRVPELVALQFSSDRKRASSEARSNR